jgi:hypothetical protein
MVPNRSITERPSRWIADTMTKSKGCPLASLSMACRTPWPGDAGIEPVADGLLVG